MEKCTTKRQLDALQQPHNKKRRKQSRPIRISTPNDVEEGEVSSCGSVQPSSLGPPAPYPPLLPSLLSFPPHFLLPMLPSSTQTPPRIFNLEAYCEICSKEFCNKYFLKTHKANRHGIYVQTGDTPPSSTTPLPPATAQLPQLPQLEVPIIVEKELQQPRFSEIKKQQQQVNSHDFKKKHKVSPCSSPSMSVHEQPLASPLSPGRLRRLGVINADAFCEICSKEYCNKYFLKTHKLKRHGILIQDLDDVPCSKGGTNIQTSPLNLALHATCSNSSDSGGVPKHENSDLTKQEAPSPKPADDLSEDLQKLQTMLLQLNSLNGTSVSCEVVNSENGADETPSPPPPPQIDPEQPQQGDTDDTNTSAPLSTSCYCDICNKELCNKYFKKVHMQKMHGIEIKDNALSGGVPCDICHKQLCSKYFVRVHKQNTHGIVDLSAATTTPSTPTRTSSPAPPPQEKQEVADLSHRYYTHFNVVCPLCSRRFRSAKWLKAHLLNDHADAGLELARELEPKQNKSSSKSDEEKCELGESSSSAGVLSNLLGDDRYHCSYCTFSTPVLSLLFVHERSHTGLPSGLTCHLCFKTFASSELLTRHVRTHQLAGLPISDVPEPYQVPQDEPEAGRYQLADEPEPAEPQEDKTAGRYRCSQCQQRFRTRDLWSAHVHSHSESPPFCCPVCPYTTDLLASFKKHVKNEHVDGALWRSLAQVEVSRTLQDAARETQVPATYAVPQGGTTVPDKFVMQAFLLEAELSNHGTFVPSLVFLPVREKVSGTLTVSFNLTPA